MEARFQETSGTSPRNWRRVCTSCGGAHGGEGRVTMGRGAPTCAGEAACGPKPPAPSGISHATAPSLSLEKPHCVTIRRAMLRTCCRSPDAPVVISSSPYTSSSTTRPARATASWPCRGSSYRCGYRCGYGELALPWAAREGTRWGASGQGRAWATVTRLAGVGSRVWARGCGLATCRYFLE